jgi:hypothetical protein
MHKALTLELKKKQMDAPQIPKEYLKEQYQ